MKTLFQCGHTGDWAIINIFLMQLTLLHFFLSLIDNPRINSFIIYFLLYILPFILFFNFTALVIIILLVLLPLYFIALIHLPSLF